MKSLILCEKPSVAKEIARVLGCTQKHKSYIEGPKYVVTWALGHLIELATPEDYDNKYKTWNLEDLPIMPERMKLKIMKETSHQYRAVAQLCKRQDLGELIVATDAGREGELVARWIMEMAGWRKPFKRLWISSQTDKAIKDGFASLKPGRDYDHLYASAVCRAEADWIVGLNVTRALTCRYDAQLSAGRVQTPTLAMLMEREREINNFKSTPYWTVTADFSGVQAQWRDPKGNARIFDQQKADSILSQVSKSNAKLTKLTKVEKLEPHPLAYDLTELQRDANKKLGFSAKMTSNVLQRLYEQHKIVTYPRTDSRYITSDMVPTLKSRLESVAVGPYAELVRPLLRKPIQATKRVVDDSKVTDHHAIIPTEQYVNLNALSSEERKLYDLIARRFIALFYPAYKYEETSLTITASGESFYAKGRVQKDSGWKVVYGNTQDFDSDDEDDQGFDERSTLKQQLPELKEGSSFSIKSCLKTEQSTKPPGRYTEAALLSQMEKHNLGTPATRADIIEKLISSDTIERRINNLVPTGKGKQLIELVAAKLRSPELTAQWEQELERIAKGKGNHKQFIQSIREQTRELVNEVKESDIDYKPHNLTHSKCPECQNFLLERNGKRGKTLVCSSRTCDYRRAAEAPVVNKRCPQCRKKMELHTGKAGKYVQCRPCNVIEKLGEQSGKVKKHQQAKLIKQYSDNETLGSSLGDALKEAMKKFE
ncbi:DNA topoisomerase III [Paenibacillus sp. N1-5-1-14]|uniref:DNA topoisomerase III n=1 Tax=Paenibacillus radicibacter TaxID=2972488 RepID=UPI0021598772|nr:DNA topoisomerase III [Paenibacillus radicibacter]MCR8643661.1 DNA topoisomerase III [Paenibacillus radicibacter]